MVCVVDFVAETDSETLPAAGRLDHQEYDEASFRYPVVLAFPHRSSLPVKPRVQPLQHLFPLVLEPSDHLFFLAQTFLDQIFPVLLCLVLTDLDSANLGPVVTDLESANLGPVVLDPDPVNPVFAVLGPVGLDSVGPAGLDLWFCSFC